MFKFKVDDRLDVIEARTEQTLDPNVQWRLSYLNDSDNANDREIFRRITIQEVGKEENKVDIWIMRGEKTIGALANNTFHVWSERDIYSIDWNRGLFR